MSFISLKRTPDHDELPSPNGHAVGEPREREFRVFPLNLAQKGDKPRGDRLPGRLLGLAFVLVFAGFVGAGIVGYEAQRLFALAHNHTGDLTEADRLRAVIIAALPDLGWVAMALVALVAALRGQSSFRARAGVLLFFALSLGAQVLYAPPTIEGILVAVIAPVAMAWMLETGLVELRRYGLSRRGIEDDEAPILTTAVRVALGLLVALLRLLLWFARLILAPKSTGAGLRDWVLDTAPIAPGRSLASMRAEQAAAEAATATATAEQVQEMAAAERQAIEAKARQDREAVEAELAEVREAAARELAQARADAARQVEQVRADAEARIRALLGEAASDTREHLDRIADLEQQLGDTRTRLTRAELTAARLPEIERKANEARGQLADATAAVALLRRYSTTKAIVRALYEDLGRRGDPRYGDRDAIGDLARDWAQQLDTDPRVVRRYLTEHLTDPSAQTEGEED